MENVEFPFGADVRDIIAKAVNPEAFYDTPDYWTLGNVKAGQEMARRTSKRILAKLNKAGFKISKKDK